MFELLRTCAAVINAAIALIRLVRDIAKEHKQKRNRRDKVSLLFWVTINQGQPSIDSAFCDSYYDTGRIICQDTYREFFLIFLFKVTIHSRSVYG